MKQEQLQIFNSGLIVTRLYKYNNNSFSTINIRINVKKKLDSKKLIDNDNTPFLNVILTYRYT